MASEKTQLNAEVSDKIAVRTKKEAAEHGVPLGGVVTAALEKFFALPIAQRRVILEQFKSVRGRKITV